MRGVAQLPAAERRVLFTETAAKSGLPALMVEKDFWVCWTLSRLYSIKGLPRLLFKGGTSLSKCFGLVQRFSEDIDLGIRREDIGLEATDWPSPAKGSSSQKKARKLLRETASSYVLDSLVPALQADFGALLTDGFQLSTAEAGSEVVIMFEYPRALEQKTYGIGDYVKPAVKMELGARSDHYPTEEISISPEAATHFPESFGEPQCTVTAQAAERTLIEKALILHSAIVGNKQRGQSSRHAYDLTAMHQSGITGRLTRQLYEDVATHKLVFSDDKSAGEAPTSGIRMVPEGELLAHLRADYASMSEMFYGEPPTFDEIMGALAALESSINSMK
jgi:Nucleotidyl transferase AbiEii toxin, Type IV TA system